MKKVIYLWPFQLISVLGILYSFYAFEWTDILMFFVAGFLLSYMGELVGLHRYFSHHSFKVNRAWHIFLVFLSTVAVSGPIVAWVSIHRNHHKTSDTENDPHSPEHRGMRNVFFANWFYYRHTPPEQIVDYNKDPLLKFTCDYYYHINVLFVLLLFLINPYLLFPLYFYPSIIGSLIVSVINTYLHRGSEIHDSKFLSYFITGDGFHKYHHDHPGEAILPSPDLSGIIIKLIRKKK